MVQRSQTIWLLLAGAIALLTFKFPFYSGLVLEKDNHQLAAKFVASYDLLTLILTAIVGVSSLIIIFLYKNRKLQFRLTIVILILSILTVVVYFMQIKHFASGELSLAAVLAFAVPIFLFFAARGIWRDERLVKSLDRLR
jgi:hypothetical protein